MSKVRMRNMKQDELPQDFQAPQAFRAMQVSGCQSSLRCSWSKGRHGCVSSTLRCVLAVAPRTPERCIVHTKRSHGVNGADMQS